MATATMEQLIECLYSDQQQEAETAALALFLLWNIDALTSETLKRIAVVVGAPVSTTVDAELRGIIRGVIAAKNSEGTVESMVEVVRLILNNADATLVELFPAELLIVSDSSPTAELAATCLTYARLAVSAGVKIGGLLIVPATDCFRLDESLLDGTDGLAEIYS